MSQDVVHQLRDTMLTSEIAASAAREIERLRAIIAECHRFCRQMDEEIGKLREGVAAAMTEHDAVRVERDELLALLAKQALDAGRNPRHMGGRS